jgi:hypothetical protein
VRGLLIHPEGFVNFVRSCVGAVSLLKVILDTIDSFHMGGVGRSGCRCLCIGCRTTIVLVKIKPRFEHHGKDFLFFGQAGSTNRHISKISFSFVLHLRINPCIFFGSDDCIVRLINGDRVDDEFITKWRTKEKEILEM